MLDKGRLRTFVLGGAVGLMAGVLLAPRSGRETRGSLANRAGEARERGRESFFDAREQVRERVADRREDGRPRDTAEGDHPPSDATVTTPRPRLRDVSSGVETADAAVGDAAEAAAEADREMERSEELRRKVRETRERLRGRRDVGREPQG